MIGRIVEIAEDQRHLHVLRGFMVVEQTGAERKEIGRVPLDDIAAVIANAHGLSYTNNLLVELAERGAPFVLCAANHNAVGMLMPIEGNFEQSKRIEAQIAAKAPTHKRLWAHIITSKLEQQAAILEATGNNGSNVAQLAKKVKSGDPENLEAQGAAKYWRVLFGNDFRRDRSLDGENALLNYGYTVLRAATARALIAAGLHPSIGLHHSNDQNAMRLVDDVMEPFRPMMDYTVWRIKQEADNGLIGVNAQTKRRMVQTLYADMQTTIGATPVISCVQRLATSIAQVYLGERDKPDLPLQPLPIAFGTPL